MQAFRFLIAAAVISALLSPVRASEPRSLPIIVPVTGFIALEGTAQRNGALLALERSGAADLLTPNVLDSGTTPEGASTALTRALGDARVPAAVASIFGPQMLAMIPIAERAGLPLLTISGTARITELGSDEVFRFFPSDDVVKRAHARFAVEERGARRPALIHQTTAYGQSGRDTLVRVLAEMGVEPVHQEALSPAVKDMAPVIAKLRAAGADSVLLHLHSGPTALFVRQAAGAGLDLPIIAGSAMHQPTTAALLEPAMLKGVCAESGSSPISGGSPAMDGFADAYRARFDQEPDAFALGQYDAVTALVAVMRAGAVSRDAVGAALAEGRFDGVAMSYKSDGKGNMAHDAVIVCYDGESRVPAIVARYGPGSAD